MYLLNVCLFSYKAVSWNPIFLMLWKIVYKLNIRHTWLSSVKYIERDLFEKKDMTCQSKKKQHVKRKIIVCLYVEVDQFTHENRFACQNIGATFVGHIHYNHIHYIDKNAPIANPLAKRKEEEEGKKHSCLLWFGLKRKPYEKAKKKN